MSAVYIQPMPRKLKLPKGLPRENAVRIETHEGTPFFQASNKVQKRIEHLLEKQRDEGLSKEEDEELNRYEAMDDYMSLLNRLARNVLAESATRG
jgi:hypothetical protein